MLFEAESNSELTVIVPTYQLHFRCKTEYTNTNVCRTPGHKLGSIAGPCDFLPARSDEFQKVCDITEILLNTVTLTQNDVFMLIVNLLHDLTSKCDKFLLNL